MMASTMSTAGSTITGLCSSCLSSSPVRLSSGFLKAPVRARNPLMVAKASGGKFTCFERDWLRKYLNVIGFGLIGWLAPSSISAINDNSLISFPALGLSLLTSQLTCSHFSILVMTGYLALGIVLGIDFWTNWIQGQDERLLHVNK